MAEKFYFLLGRDVRYPNFSGKIGYLNINLGKGSFRLGDDFTHKNDIFGYGEGEDKLLPKVKEVSTKSEGVLKVPYDGNSPKSEEFDADHLPRVIDEYGYGFWMRYLTYYPKIMLSGKNGPWYFTARLTINKPFGDIGMGDRVLAIWQGQGYYHFTSNNVAANNPNIITNVPYGDIEGLWTYVYYSHHRKEKRTVGFIQYGPDTEPKRIEMGVTHKEPQYMKFILAGKQFSYPSFNGIFTDVEFNVGDGAFIDKMDHYDRHMKKLGDEPSGLWDRLVTLRIIKSEPEKF